MSECIRLDPKEPGKSELDLRQFFHEQMISQDRAINHLVRKLMYANSLQGRLRNHRKPAGSFIYLGPTGVGKTRLVEVFARLLFGSYEAMVKIDCSELQERHEISRLIGSPPGYVGYNNEPWLSQRRIDSWGYFAEHKDSEPIDQLQELYEKMEALEKEIKEFEQKNGIKHGTKEKKDEKPPPELIELLAKLDSLRKIYDSIVKKQKKYRPGAYPAIILFDEIEKASGSLFNLLLQVHDKGMLTLNGSTAEGNNQVFFHNTLIFYTSNIAQSQIQKILRNSGIGYVPTFSSDNSERQIYKTALTQLEKFFSPEFLGRIGKENIIVFSPLARSDIREGLERIIIPNFISRLSVSFPISLTVTEGAREFLVDESFASKNKAFGMRAVGGKYYCIDPKRSRRRRNNSRR